MEDIGNEVHYFIKRLDVVIMVSLGRQAGRQRKRQKDTGTGKQIGRQIDSQVRREYGDR